MDRHPRCLRGRESGTVQEAPWAPRSGTNGEAPRCLALRPAPGLRKPLVCWASAFEEGGCPPATRPDTPLPRPAICVMAVISCQQKPRVRDGAQERDTGHGGHGEGTQLTFEAPAGGGIEDRRRTRPIRRITRDDVMTAAEVAQLLALPKSTVYELARRGELPCARLGRTMRFLREEVEARLRPSPG